MLRSHGKIVGFCLLFGLSACSSSETLLLEKVVTEVGPEGGTAASADGRLALEFAAGALQTQTDISVETRTLTDIPRLVSLGYELGPDGLTFDAPVKISIEVESDEEVAVYQIVGTSAVKVPSSVWDPEAQRVEATLEHFSMYAALVVYNPCAGLSCGDPCVTCDPLDPSCVEPPPSVKACNRSGLCVDAILPVCQVIDAGMPPADAGSGDAGTSTSSPDAGGIPDAGAPVDAGFPGCVDIHTQNPQPRVDLLIVMDDSCSMSQEQATLAASFGTLLSTLTQNNVDFQIGVTTTDMSPTGARGSLEGSPAILTPSTPNLAAAFANNVRRGVDGSAVEQAFAASVAALDAATSTHAALFVRDTSSLTVLYASDEPEQSVDTVAVYRDALFAAKGPQGQRLVQVNAIVGDVPSGCNGPNGSATAGPRFHALAADTQGATDSICTSPWNDALTDLGRPGFGYRIAFPLAQPAPGGILRVEVDGVVAPSSHWVYDAVAQAVIFVESAVPGPNAQIVIVSGC